MKEYKVLSGEYIEHIIEELNKHSNEGWAIVGTIQERGTTKVILEKEI